MLATFIEIILGSSTVGIVAGCSTVFAQLVGRKMRTEKPLDLRSRTDDLRTW